MRASFGALTVVAVLGAASPVPALAFDRPLCDELRRTVDNVDLARRISSDPPGGDLECLVRIAAVRLSADDAVYEAQSETLMKLALAVDDLRALETLDARRGIATRLRAASDAFSTDSLYRASLTTPARNDLFQQLNQGKFLDADTMRTAEEQAREPAPAAPPAEEEEGAAADDGETEVAALDEAPAPAPSTGCLAPADVDDADVKRADELDGICITRTVVRDGAVAFDFLVLTNEANPDGPVWYVMHDDEDEAFDAGLHSVRTFGGKMIALDGDETRDFAGLDPNRIFAATPDAACEGGTAYPNYVAFIEGQFAGAKQILALHNNPDGGAVTARIRNARLRGWQARRGKFRDLDNIVFFAGTSSYNRSRDARRTRDRLLGAGLNVVYEQVTPRTNDCSFSNWAVLNDKPPYFNIDAETGTDVQDGMVDALLGVLGHKKLRRR